MESIEKLKENLNNQQLEAVTTTEGFVRVIAGAGSGKTRALISRYIYIVEALGISSSNILCVTFTNKAAQEMRNRVKRILGQNTDLSYITTYHGFCVRVLREDINKIHYPKNFIIMDVEDQKTVIRSVFNELGLSSKDFTFKQVLRYISKCKTSLDYLQYILESKKQESDNDLEKVFIRYLEKQQRNYALDFDDLINYTIYIFSKNEETLNKWQNRLHYIQVDETQDSSEKQFSLMEMLSRIHKNLFVVGDPDQTIYEWRGAKPEILVDFDKQFKDSKTIIMDQNYRSTPNILNLGNHIIKNNKIRVDKDMFTKNKEGVEVVHFHGQDEVEEGLWVAKEIKRLVEVGHHHYYDVAVLYRAHHVSRYIEQAFIKENLPYSVFGGIRFFERKEIKDVLAYLRLIEIGDDFSFLRIISTPRRGLGKIFVENVAKFAQKEDTSLFSALKNNIHLEEFNRQGAVDFLALIERMKILKTELTVSDLIKEILDQSGLSAYYRLDGDMERLDNIKELQNSIILLETENEEKISLTEYLQEIALYTNMDIDNDKNDKVKLMTIHTSKGLEFPYVFLCGFTEGIIPSAMSLKERRVKALEEERRLTYVAITRAEKGFYMTESEGFNFSTSSNKYPSRFLFEINESFYVRKGELDQELVEEAKEQLDMDLNVPIINTEFKVGDIVNHPIWNKGKIIEINDDKGEYKIEFLETGKIKPITFEFKGLETIESTKHRYNFSNYYENKRINKELKNIESQEIRDKIQKLSERSEDNEKWQKIAFLNQAKAYNFMDSVTDQEIKNRALDDYPNDYVSQKKYYQSQSNSKEYMSKIPNNPIKDQVINKFPYDYNQQFYYYQYKPALSDITSDEYQKAIEAKEFMESVKDSLIKKRIVKKWPIEYDMQKRQYESETKAKDYMESVKDSSIKRKAIEEWPNNYDKQKENYDMQKIIYENQANSKEFMDVVTDKLIKKRAEKEWPNNYDMQKYLYEQELEGKEFMDGIPDSSIKRKAIKEWPNNYNMQKYEYEKLMRRRK